MIESVRQFTKMSMYPIPITLPTPFPVGPINVYFFPGQEPALVDTGPRTRLTMDALRQALAAQGYAISQLRHVIITHAHVDHFGLAAQIVAESGARVYTHRRNFYWLSEFEEEWLRRRRFYYGVFRQSGLPQELIEAIGAASNAMTRYAQSVSVDVLLEDGDTLSLGGDEWRVLHTPGHAGGLICLYQPQERLLLSSDHLLKDITSNPLLEPPERDQTARRRSLIDYLASLQRVAAIEVSLVLPAHGEPILDHRALIAQRFRFHRERQDRILALLADGPKVAYNIAQALFPGLSPMDTFLAISEVIGHMDVLEEEGRVVQIHRDGLVYYARA